MNKELRILGIRGIPASHGGFETFAEKLAVYLSLKGWKVTVYCQVAGEGKTKKDTWQGINRVLIPEKNEGPLGTIIFDLKSMFIASRESSGVNLVLGYNTAIFLILLKVSLRNSVINMDGIEWKRDKWGKVAKFWFWMNERFGSWFGDKLIADHPEIKNHLAKHTKSSKIEMIPYGAERVVTADDSWISKYSLQKNNYYIVIARPEPENSIHIIVEAFEGYSGKETLVILGDYVDSNPYHQMIKKSANNNVLFLGAIYDSKALESLRYFSKGYIHGHTVGGTNPSLVEALGAGQPVIAHDNKFNRWVAGDAGEYFSNSDDLRALLERIKNDQVWRESKSKLAYEKHDEEFRWNKIFEKYENLLLENT